ncbi:zinc finger BED domain-containing protein 4-like [Rhagoletis pomonella]|uniref:zinc finger BED domain-containing protein 4-like n=2 Tax=Rhagoletis pomonella TaxID=28610 RepID=UPI00178532E7|nr:zinc finger BED domain-containing protein 4-like [Rhagoletis pomonella]
MVWVYGTYRKNIQDISHKCRKIVGHFKRSEQACRYLKKCQETLGLPNHSLIQEVVCRWNSTYLMLSRLYEQKAAINLYIAERGSIEILSVSEWADISNVISVLKPFYQATLDLSYESTCASVIIPLISMIQIKLESNDNDGAEIAMLKVNLKTSLSRRFEFIKTNTELLISTLLDPRFKQKYFSTAETRRCETLLKEQINTNKDSLEVLPAVSPTRSSETIHTNNLWESHDSDILSQGIEVKEGISQLKKQLDSYLNEQRIPRDSNIFEYWHQSPYFLLKKIATKYMSAPASSVASEQLFSAAGQLYSDRRTNLLGENANKLLFLHYNIKLFNFDY